MGIKISMQTKKIFRHTQPSSNDNTTKSVECKNLEKLDYYKRVLEMYLKKN